MAGPGSLGSVWRFGVNEEYGESWWLMIFGKVQDWEGGVSAEAAGGKGRYYGWDR